MTTQNLVYVDPEFERDILASVLQKKPEVLSGDIPSLLKPEAFSVPIYRWLVEKMEGNVPSKATVVQWIHDAYPDDDKREKSRIALLGLFDLQVEDVEGAADSIRRFLCFQTVTARIASSLETFKKDRNIPFLLRDLEEGIQQGGSILYGSKLQVVDYASDWKRRQDDRKVRRDNPELHPRLRLGIPMFDQQVKMETGTVTAILAPMKRYKSVILASGAFAAILQGYNTVMVVLENSVDMTLSRLDSMVTRIGYDRIVNALLTGGERQYADKLVERLDSWAHRLKVIKGEPYRTGVAQLRPELRRLELNEGFVPEVFIYDYLNIGKASISKSEDGRRLEAHEIQTRIAFDLQGVAKDKKHPCIVMTAAQTNMEGLGLDKSGRPIKIGAQHQGQSIGIGQAVDANVAVNVETVQTEDTGWQPPQLVLSILYLRDGKIIQPDIPLVSIIDEMCIDRSMRALWDEVDDGLPSPNPIF